MQNYRDDIPMLFTLLEEYGGIEDFVRDMFHFDILCSQNFELTYILFDPLKTVETKLAWIDEMLVIYFSTTYLDYLRQLVRNEDFGNYERLRVRFFRVLSRMQNCLYAKVTTAIPLEPGQSERIAAKLKALFGKRIFVYNKVSRYFPSGLLIECGDTMIDLGARTGIEQLKKTLNAS